MIVAYLVLAHHAPAHLGRLTKALACESSAIFVHIDAKSDLGAFIHLEGASVHFAQERVRVTWGDFSQVEAILVLLRAALDDSRHFDRFVLISGVDYPLRSASFIQHFFESNPDQQYINLAVIPDLATGKPIDRLTTYQPRRRQGRIGSAIWRLLMGVSRRVHRRDYEHHLRGLTPYGGSTWWALTRDAVEHIVQFATQHTRIVEFFRHSISPDESFFQTILGNSHFQAATTANLTYTDWSPGTANPAPITDAHLTVFESLSGRVEHLFARKFGDDDVAIVSRLDRFIDECDRAADSDAGRLTISPRGPETTARR